MDFNSEREGNCVIPISNVLQSKRAFLNFHCIFLLPLRMAQRTIFPILCFYLIFFTLLFIKLKCFCNIHEFSSSPGVGVGCCFAAVSPAGSPAQPQSTIKIQNLAVFKLGRVVVGGCFFLCGWNMLVVVVVVYFIPMPEGRNVLNIFRVLLVLALLH